ncbi:hypothetical protein [Arenibacter sp. S6351L]|uniref:hypothetical protein n=1 Tax=Arenibacter sp. S6351L TaxID=2926407 RepID=UPI001FF105C3|nr:hypothetical protein [Arenibacter sp. S6351L]MCK0135835.1 hypothetical protein [Arenibacter sp. S6351L]
MEKLFLIPFPVTKENVDEVLNALLVIDIITKTDSDRNLNKELVEWLRFNKKLSNSNFDPSKTFNDYILKTNDRIKTFNN